jgi:hypothetical protein
MAASRCRPSVESIVFGRHGLLYLVVPSGACRCPSLIIRGTMYDITGESKTMPLSGPTKSRHLLLWWCVDKEISVELLFFGGDRSGSRRGFVVRLWIGFFVS